MKKLKLANITGILILSFDILLVVILITFKSIRWMDWDEFNQTMALIIPIRGFYVGQIVKYLTSVRLQSEDEEHKSSLYSVMVITILILHQLGLIGAIIVFGLGGNTNINWLRNSIASIETFFGIYLSQLIPDLFSTSKVAPSNSI